MNRSRIENERARIAVSIQDDYRTAVDRQLFAPVARLEHFACPTSRQDLRAIEADTAQLVHSLTDLIEAMRVALAQAVTDGAVGIKIGIAYRRALKFDKVARADAERLFARLFAHLGEGLSWEEARPLQDYMFHEIVRAGLELNVPIQIHTGLQEGNENLLANANPLLLANLFLEYRQAKFDLFHGGYPFMGEALALAKNFSNVYLDLCWLHIIDPVYAQNLLSEGLTAVPHGKIHGFGGDFRDCILHAAAHLSMARDVIAAALGERVASGWLGEDEAAQVAADWLFNNPNEFFKLGYEPCQVA
jgi:predicted TIM-barrel fold metal-dependent hydrolase